MILSLSLKHTKNSGERAQAGKARVSTVDTVVLFLKIAKNSSNKNGRSAAPGFEEQNVTIVSLKSKSN